MDLILLQPGDPKVCAALVDVQTSPLDVGGGDVASMINSSPTFELISFNQGMAQQVTTDVSNTARTTERPTITDITCVKYVDKTSVTLYDYCLRAKPLDDEIDKPTRLYLCRSAGDEISPIMTLSLRSALITEIQFQSHPNDMATEQFKLNFNEILWTYVVEDKSGQAAGNPSGWSVVRNRPISEFVD